MSDFPTAATGGFPYPGRTCAEWIEPAPVPVRHYVPVDHSSEVVSFPAVPPRNRALIEEGPTKPDNGGLVGRWRQQAYHERVDLRHAPSSMEQLAESWRR